MQERTPERSQNKVVCSVTVTPVKGHPCLTLSTYTLKSRPLEFFTLSFVCESLHFTPRLSMNLLPQILFSYSKHISSSLLSSLQIEGLLSFQHVDGNLPTTVSRTFSSQNNLLLSWVELLYRALHQGRHTWLCKFLQPFSHSANVPVRLPHAPGSVFGLGEKWESHATA